MKVLGISCFFHDAAAALVCEGRVVAAAEEERFSRIKHDASFPEQAIAFCLRKGALTAGDLDYAVFYEKPFVKFERILSGVFAYSPGTSRLFREVMVTWLRDKLWIRNRIASALDIPRRRILFLPHHLSHAASAFLCSPFADAAIVTADGVGEWSTATIGTGSGGACAVDREIRYPHSLGLLYSAFTAYLGFQVNEGEYKVMGLAGYGVPRYVDQMRKVIRLAADGSFELDLGYFSFHHSTSESFSPSLVSLFGAPRTPGAPFVPSRTETRGIDGAPAPLEADNQRFADIAASLQLVTQDAMCGLVRAACAASGADTLCLAGGVALNGVANSAILRDTPARRLYVQPAPGDSGAAIGAALYVGVAVGGDPRAAMDHVFLGDEYADDAAVHGVRERYLHATAELDDGELLQRTVEMLSAGQVIGWFQGRFEFGPRALGGRSILADPTRASMQDTVNLRVKFREPFRPFAPSVPADAASRYFDVPPSAVQTASDFMLLVRPVHRESAVRLPAVTHVDGTARVHTVRRETNPLYHDLIVQFGEATGTPVLLNTSFNVQGQPIVSTPAEALDTFLQSGLDAVVMGRRIVSRKAAAT
jgi:carbamoyltransferase